MKVSLGDHVDLLTGFPFKSAQYTTCPDDVLLLRGDNIAQGRLRWDGAKRWSKADLGDYEKFVLAAGDVVLAMDRPWIEAGLKWGWISERAPTILLVQRVARLRGTNGLLTEYLRYVIGSKEFADHVLSIVTGINVPHISARDIKSFQFQLPPLGVQRCIADILSAYDDLIENNTRRIAILEETARLIFEEWFVHFRAPGSESARMIDSPVGPIPQTWRVQLAGEVIEFDPQTSVSRSGGTPFLPMTSLQTQSMFVGEIETRTDATGSKFRNGDTLLARITPCLENGKTGFVDFLDGSNAVGIGSTEFIVMRGKTVPPEFVQALARSDLFRAHAIKSMSGATGRQRVRRESLEQFQIAIPPGTTLDRYRDLAAPMYQLGRSLFDANQNLRQQRDLLLPKLISGEADVSERSTVKEAAE